MWYDFQLDNSPQETNMTQKLTTIGHRTAFNNEKAHTAIKHTEITNVVSAYEKTNGSIFAQKCEQNNIYNH